MLIPLGVHVACREGKFTVAASAWFYKLRLYPAKKKAEKSEEKTEADAETEDKPQKNFDLGFALDDWLKLIRVALRALGRFKNGGKCLPYRPAQLRLVRFKLGGLGRLSGGFSGGVLFIKGTTVTTVTL